MQNPRRCNWNGSKCVLLYLTATKDYGINSRKSADNLHGYTDTEFARDRSDRKSTSGCVFMNSEGAISWRSKKKEVFAQSTCESNYISMSYAICEAVWLRGLLSEIFGKNKCIPESKFALTIKAR